MNLLTRDEIIAMNQEVLNTEGNGDKTVIYSDSGLDMAVKGNEACILLEQVDPKVIIYFLARGIAGEHAFSDANKRTAAKAISKFLEMNQWRWTGTSEELLTVVGLVVMDQESEPIGMDEFMQKISNYIQKI